MGSRIQSHQLSNGLYVSGRPEQLLKERQPTMGARAVPYTGGDVKKSGELGKMFDIAVLDPASSSSSTTPPPLSKLSRPSSSSQPNSGSVRSGPNSGPIHKKSSGPIPLPPTGLITSGPLSGERDRARKSGQLDHAVSMKKTAYGAGVTALHEEGKGKGKGKKGIKNGNFPYKLPKVAMWVGVGVVAMALLVGSFLMITVKRPLFLVAAGALLVPVVFIALWNCARKRREILGFINRYPDAELRSATDGQYVKVTGVINQ